MRIIGGGLLGEADVIDPVGVRGVPDLSLEAIGVDPVDVGLEKVIRRISQGLTSSVPAKKCVKSWVKVSEETPPQTLVLFLTLMVWMEILAMVPSPAPTRKSPLGRMPRDLTPSEKFLPLVGAMRL